MHRIERDEHGFFERFRVVMSQLASEGIELQLLLLLIDHVAREQPRLRQEYDLSMCDCHCS